MEKQIRMEILVGNTNKKKALQNTNFNLFQSLASTLCWLLIKMHESVSAQVSPAGVRSPFSSHFQGVITITGVVFD